MWKLSKVLVAAAVMAAGQLGAPALAAPAEGNILGAGEPGTVSDSYLVVLKEGTGDRAAEFAKRANGRFGHKFKHALRGFEMAMSEKAAKRLAADPAVSYVEQNRTVTVTGTQSPVPSWGLDRIDQPLKYADNSYTYPATGAGVRAYLIDTGIRFSHSEFGGRAVSGFDAIDGGPADDANGHGTHVAATVGGAAYGVAKGVTLVAVRVLNASGTGTMAQVIAGIDWVTGDHDPGERAVANVSLGARGTALNAAVAASIADGVTYVVAAGNGNTDACTFTPAGTPEAITVAATDANDTRTSSSNYGACVDIFAPGAGVVSAWHTSDTATRTLSGTSQAAPHVTGAAAIVLEQYRGFTPAQVRDTLVRTGTGGAVGNPGTGSINRLLFVAPTDDFSIEAKIPTLVVSRGSWASNQIMLKTIAGTPHNVTLTESLLPPGVTIDFGQETVTTSANVTAVIQASATTPLGRHTITFTGTSAAGSHSTSFTLVVRVPTCLYPGQILPNPGFEAGVGNWTGTPGVIAQRPAEARSGSWNARFLGYEGEAGEDMNLSLNVPAGCGSYVLSFFLRTVTAEHLMEDIDGLQLWARVGDVPWYHLGYWSNAGAAGGYVHVAIDVSLFAGQQVLMEFSGWQDRSLPTTFSIDDMELNLY